ncbi:hypothetical protein DL89DRAFT_254391 [Linderina pennispora]|uniref:ADF-H domain-containing protein n=1 Tax=Linderina pennispora TaxID=61395 RepID=A0A1Y1WLY2_9FUNG|nr:uncharacterized protein DL89DRAFT_254391 [Linderina pennispora]ORX74580.1 hypothetical protein DL89DRAFT_254391 [Linderina pennispora]
MAQSIPEEVVFAFIYFEGSNVLVTHVSEKISGVQRARGLAHQRVVAAYFSHYDVTVNTSKPSELTPGMLRAKTSHLAIKTLPMKGIVCDDAHLRMLSTISQKAAGALVTLTHCTYASFSLPPSSQSQRTALCILAALHSRSLLSPWLSTGKRCLVKIQSPISTIAGYERSRASSPNRAEKQVLVSALSGNAVTRVDRRIHDRCWRVQFPVWHAYS